MCGNSTTTTSSQTADPTTLSRQGGIWNAASGQGPANVPLPTPPAMTGNPSIDRAAQATYGQQMTAYQAAQNAPNLGVSVPKTYTPYGGEQVAGLTPDQLASYGLARTASTAAQPGLNASSQAIQGLMGYQPSQVGGNSYNPALASNNGAGIFQAGPVAQAGAGGIPQVGTSGVSAAPATAQQTSTSSIPQTDLSGYMNPYTQNVVDTTNAQLQQAQGQALNAVAGTATQQGAFGGSRSGVAQALTTDAYGRTIASTDAGLNQANYAQATQNAQQDMARRLSSDQGNQSTAAQVGIANENAGVQAGAVNAQTGLAASQANAANALNTGIWNAGAVNQGNQFNAGLLNQGGQFNATLGANTNQFNAGAQNAAGQFNASTAQGAQMANQGAGLAGAQFGLSAAGALGNNAIAGQNAMASGAGLLAQAGGAQQTQGQNVDNAAYQQWQATQQYPAQYLSWLNGLTGTPGQNNTSTVTKNESPLSAIPGLLSAASSFIPGLGAARQVLGSAGTQGQTPYGEALTAPMPQTAPRLGGFGLGMQGSYQGLLAQGGYF